jgi:hypothetical protein
MNNPDANTNPTPADAIVGQLRLLPRIHGPPGFASALATEIASTASLGLHDLPRLPAPVGFANQMATEIASTASLGLFDLPRLSAPLDFASHMATEIASTASLGLHDLPRLPAPVGFAHGLALAFTQNNTAASHDRLGQSLQRLPRIQAPAGFALTLALDIANEASANPLNPALDPIERALPQLPRLQAPANFAQQLASQIASQPLPPTPSPDPLERRLAALPRQVAPAAFAQQLASQIAAQASRQANGQARVQAVTQPALAQTSIPLGFAPALAARIAADTADSANIPTGVNFIQPINTSNEPVPFLDLARRAANGRERQSTPFYFLSATLLAAMLVVVALVWPQASDATRALVAIGESLPPTLLVWYLVAALLALVAASGRVRIKLLPSLAAFAIGAAIIWPQVLPSFGARSVERGIQTGTTVRLAGDLAVRGVIDGDAIAIGGNVRIEAGARVTGRVIALLGDVAVSEEANVQSASAILGSSNTPGLAASNALGGFNPTLISAASTLRPLKNLIQTDFWPLLYLAVVAASAAWLLWMPGWLEPLSRSWRANAGRSLGVGLLAAALALPLALLGGLSVIAAPLALLLVVVALALFTVGLGLSALELGQLLLQRWRGQRLDPAVRDLLEVVLGISVLSLSLLLPSLALTLWVLGGAWGAGALLLAWQRGRLHIQADVL